MGSLPTPQGESILQLALERTMDLSLDKVVRICQAAKITSSGLKIRERNPDAITVKDRGQNGEGTACRKQARKSATQTMGGNEQGNRTGRCTRYSYVNKQNITISLTSLNSAVSTACDQK